MTDDNNDQNQNMPLSIPLGGSVESQPVFAAETPRNPDAESGEIQRAPESLKFGEKAKEQNTERRTAQPQPPQQPQPQVKIEPKQTVFPKVYGYKIPASMQKKLHNLRAGKGNPNQGMTWLKVFVDRLLKMESN